MTLNWKKDTQRGDAATFGFVSYSATVPGKGKLVVMKDSGNAQYRKETRAKPTGKYNLGWYPKGDGWYAIGPTGKKTKMGKHHEYASFGDAEAAAYKFLATLTGKSGKSLAKPPTLRSLDIIRPPAGRTPVFFWTNSFRPDMFTGASEAAKKAALAALKGGREGASYRGSARCRICNARLGNKDMYNAKYIWPENGPEHYVKVHGVVPPPFTAATKPAPAEKPAPKRQEAKWPRAETKEGTGNKLITWQKDGARVYGGYASLIPKAGGYAVRLTVRISDMIFFLDRQGGLKHTRLASAPVLSKAEAIAAIRAYARKQKGGKTSAPAAGKGGPCPGCGRLAVDDPTVAHKKSCRLAYPRRKTRRNPEADVDDWAQIEQPPDWPPAWITTVTLPPAPGDTIGREFVCTLVPQFTRGNPWKVRIQQNLAGPGRYFTYTDSPVVWSKTYTGDLRVIATQSLADIRAYFRSLP